MRSLGLWPSSGHGDLFITVPTFRAIRASYPDLRIHVWGLPDSCHVLKYAGIIDSYGDQRKGMREPCPKPDIFVGFAHRPDELRARAVEAGYRRVKASVIHNTEQRDQHRHYDAVIRRALPMGAPMDWSAVQLEVPAAIDHELDGAVFLHPYSLWGHKCWQVERFLALADELDALGFPVVLIEPPDHLLPPTRFPVYLGPMLDLAFRLTRAAGYIGNDSGMTHLAGMLGVPTLALFGPSEPGRWAPYGPRARWLRCCPGAPTPTLGCSIHEDGHTCFERMTVELVVQQFLELVEVRDDRSLDVGDARVGTVSNALRGGSNSMADRP